MLDYGLQVVLLSIVNVRVWSAGSSTLDSYNVIELARVLDNLGVVSCTGYLDLDLNLNKVTFNRFTQFIFHVDIDLDLDLVII